MEDVESNFGKEINEEEIYILTEQMMDKLTFNRNRLKMIICMIFLFFADGMEMRLFYFIIKPFGDYFNLEETDVEIQFGASSIFLGIMIGSASASLLTKKFGRIKILNISNIIYFISRLIMGIWLNVPLFIICRSITGIALGIIIPIFMNVYGEYLPDKYRGLLLMMAWAVFGLGELILSLIGLGVMPELEKDKLQTFVLILAIFPFLNLICGIFLLRDSPKGILLSKKIEETKTSTKGLSEIKLININTKNKEEKGDDEKTAENNVEDYSTLEIIKEMFGPTLKKTTILMILLFVFFGYNAFGIYSVTSYFLDYLDEEENGTANAEREAPAKDIIINQILLCLADFVGNIVGGFFGEIKKFGRKGGIIFFLIIASVLTIISLFKKILFEITSPIYSGCTEIYVNLLMDYVVELYPTKIRDTSTSLLFLVYRISCFLCNFISLGFYDINKYVPFIIYTIFAVLSIFLTHSLPYEMAGKAMK